MIRVALFIFLMTSIGSTNSGYANVKPEFGSFTQEHYTAEDSDTQQKEIVREKRSLENKSQDTIQTVNSGKITIHIVTKGNIDIIRDQYQDYKVVSQYTNLLLKPIRKIDLEKEALSVNSNIVLYQTFTKNGEKRYAVFFLKKSKY